MFLRESIGYLWQGLGLSGSTAQNGAALSGGGIVQGITGWISGLFGKKSSSANAATTAAGYISDHESSAMSEATEPGFFAKVTDGLKSAFSSACDFFSGLLPDSIKNIDWQGI